MLAKKVVALAEEYCDGKIVFVLEGGYDPVNVANGAEAVFIARQAKGSQMRTIQIHTKSRIANRASKKYASGMDSDQRQNYKYALVECIF